MKPTDSKERLKALMHQHAANAVAATPTLTTATANPPPVAIACISNMAHKALP